MSLTRLILVFFVGSFIGWIIDSLGGSLLDRKWYRGGFSILPLCPVYGFGIVLLILFAPVLLSQPLPATFFLVTLLLTALEYVAGIFSEKVFKKRLWNYTKWRWDLHGRIEPFHSFIWGVLGTAFLELVYPRIISYLTV